MTFLMAPSTGRDPRNESATGNQGSSVTSGPGFAATFGDEPGQTLADQAAAEPDHAAAEHHEHARDRGDHGGHGHHRLGTDIRKEHFRDLGWC